ncbi:MAG: hypothetical protein U1E45_11810 [Geminicoccaceae bacterium]
MPIARHSKVVALILAVLPLAALAAPPEPPAPVASVHGTVAHYTLTAKGSVDGFVLDDGTQVRLAQRSTDLAFAVKPGDSVTVQGRRPADGPLFQAVEVKNDGSGVVVVKAASRGKKADTDTRVEGRVRFPLFGAKGQVVGAILEDGTVVRLAKAAIGSGAPDFTAGKLVAVEGVVRTKAMGRVVEVTKLD